MQHTNVLRSAKPDAISDVVHDQSKSRPSSLSNLSNISFWVIKYMVAYEISSAAPIISLRASGVTKP
jgi:hypothetical protein